jgi:hypothetical protein
MIKERLVHDFIQRMDNASNSQASYGLKVTHLELRDIGKKHLTSYGETNVEELIHYLDGLAELIHPKAKFAVRLAAEGLQRRLNVSKAREEDEQEALRVQSQMESYQEHVRQFGTDTAQ